MKVTEIISNGSRCIGEEADTIKNLLKVLKSKTIEERFFETYKTVENEKTIQHNFCPITTHNKVTKFFGNFEEVSHVFNIATNDVKIIKELTKAIKENKGWVKYYGKNLLNIR